MRCKKTVALDGLIFIFFSLLIFGLVTPVFSADTYIVTEYSGEKLSKITSGVRTEIYNFKIGTTDIYPSAVAVDGAGNYIVTTEDENYYGMLYRITPSGGSTTVYGFQSNQNPFGVAVDGAGNYIVAESGLYPRLTKITPSGVGTVAYDYYNKHGTLIHPQTLAIDSAGNYIVTEFNAGQANTLSSISLYGYRTVIYTFTAGEWPNYIAIDGAGNYIVTDNVNDRLYKITPAGVMTVIYDTSGAQFQGVDVDGAGNYIVAESYAQKLSKITPGGVRTVIYDFSPLGYADPTGVAIVPGTGYDVTIWSWCGLEPQGWLSQPITMDGGLTGYTTPHTFTGLNGTHTFTVPSTDPNGHPFYEWSTGPTNRTLTVTAAGTYTARYGSAVSIGEAVDNTTLTWTTGGSTNWKAETAVSYNGGDAAQSGAIGNNGSTYVQTTVTGPGTLTFYWRVSSEANYDFLRFSIDGANQASISGTVNWQQKSYTIAAGTHTLRWTYSKDGSVVAGSDAGWLDKVVFTPGVSIGEAVDNTTVSWTTGGSANWYGQTAVSYNGGDAARSGAIGNNGSTYVQTTVTGPGKLTFYWRVSSEAGYDFLRFSIDGANQASISGTVNWQQKSYTIAAGTHTLRWTYSKDGSVVAGSDAGWLDKVVFGPPASEIVVDNRSANTTYTGGWWVSGATGYYGSDSVWSRDGTTFTWKFTPGQTGAKNVAMWWTQWPSRSTSIPVDIQHAGGTSRVYINQQTNGGKWNLLGTYNFTAGTTYSIKITSQPNPTSTCADAVRIY